MVNVEYKYTLESHAVYNSITHLNNGFLEFGNIFFFVRVRVFFLHVLLLLFCFCLFFSKKDGTVFVFGREMISRYQETTYDLIKCSHFLFNLSSNSLANTFELFSGSSYLMRKCQKK